MPLGTTAKSAMAFTPRMQSEAHGFSLVEDLVWRGWDGVVVDVWRVTCASNANGFYTSPDPRLFVVLELTPGGRLELSDEAGLIGVHAKPWSMSYVAGGTPVRSRAVGIAELRHLDIHLPEAALVRRFGKTLDPERLGRTRLQFEDPTLTPIIALLLAECLRDRPMDDRYGAGLIDALLTVLFDIRREERRARPSLSRAQLNQSLDYIDAHCFEPIRLSDLASLLGLSETYFSHAFKASTGVPPSRWQMETRIGKIKELLVSDQRTLTEIAILAGFSDQAHLTRSFKRLVGVTPSDWRRNARDNSASGTASAARRTKI